MDRGTPTHPQRDLLVISDLHLGEGLGSPKSEHMLELERALIAFLDHHADDGHAWRLVVNGDMFEMSALSISPAELGLSDGLHPHELQYGVGARQVGADHKLRRILERHAAVFDAFARFVAAGHSLALVIGNHDVELTWPAVRRRLVDDLVARAVRAGAAEVNAREAVSFHPWFFYEQGLAWIEHGHQYDPYCSFEEVLAPATDDREIDPNLGGLLPRYIGPRMGGPMHHAWDRGFWGYLAFWWQQGWRRLGGVLQAYLDVVRRMVEHWQARVPARLEARRRRARMRLRRLARRMKLPVEVLAELQALAHSPVSVDLRRILQALMVDRLLLLIAAPFLLVYWLALPADWAWYGVGAAAVPIAPWLWLALRAREPVDPSPSMRAVARRIRERMRVRFVVMGHSHRAEAHPDDGYLNSGHWVPSDAAHAFTHVRIERTSGGVRAVLCQWRDGVSRSLAELGAAVRPQRS